MARNKPSKAPQDGAEPFEVTPQQTASGVMGGTAMEPGVVGFDEKGRPHHVAMVPLVDPHRVVGTVVPKEPNPAPPPLPKYVVEQGGNVLVGGHIVLLRVGKVLDPLSYDVAKLLEVPSIRLRKLEA